MRKNFEDYYFKALKQWNMIHRIIGKTPPRQLYEESVEALGGLSTALYGKTLVDVGAGSGIVGFPWLMLDPTNKVLFVEPDAKKAAFIAHILSNWSNLQNRSCLSNSSLESVSRETLDHAVVGEGRYFLVARAFSGSVSLSTAINESLLCDAEAYKFSSESEIDANGVKKLRYLLIKL